MNNKKREGNYTSSKISKLCMSNKKGDDFGAPAFTYIEEKRIESKMKRCLDVVRIQGQLLGANLWK